VGAALAAFFAAKAAPITAFYPSYLVTDPKNARTVNYVVDAVYKLINETV
jgi:hypothetical protein